MTIYDDLFKRRGRSVTINPPPYRVHATFRIFHVDLDPTALTKMLSVKPSQTHKAGDPRISKKGKLFDPYRQGCWLLDSQNHVKSEDMNKHINWILDELSSCTCAIKKLQNSDYFIDIVCGWLTEADNTCPILNAETIGRLARLPIDCWFDVYMLPPDD